MSYTALQKNWTYNVYFDFIYTFRLKHFLLYEGLSDIWYKYTGLQVKYPIILITL
jgi:hypothetical protein